MTQKDQNGLSMWKAVDRLLSLNVAVTSSVPPFASASADLTAAIDAAEKALQAQATGSKGVTENKEALEETAIDQVMRISKSMKAYAIENKDHGLITDASINRSGLLAMPQNELVARLNNILKLANNHAAALVPYGVSAAKLSDAANTVKAYDDYIAAPRNSIGDRAGVTASVPQIMKAGRNALERMDNLVHLFEASHPEFVSGYKMARVIVDIGGRKDPPASQDPAA